MIENYYETGVLILQCSGGATIILLVSYILGKWILKKKFDKEFGKK